MHSPYKYRNQQNLQGLHNTTKNKKEKKSGKAYENFKTLLYFLLLSEGKVMSFLYTSALIVSILEEVMSASCHSEENHGCAPRVMGKYL